MRWNGSSLSGAAAADAGNARAISSASRPGVLDMAMVMRRRPDVERLAAPGLRQPRGRDATARAAAIKMSEPGSGLGVDQLPSAPSLRMTNDGARSKSALLHAAAPVPSAASESSSQGTSRSVRARWARRTAHRAAGASRATPAGRWSTPCVGLPGGQHVAAWAGGEAAQRASRLDEQCLRRERGAGGEAQGVLTFSPRSTSRPRLGPLRRARGRGASRARSPGSSTPSARARRRARRGCGCRP